MLDPLLPELPWLLAGLVLLGLLLDSPTFNLQAPKVTPAPDPSAGPRSRLPPPAAHRYSADGAAFPARPGAIPARDGRVGFTLSTRAQRPLPRIQAARGRAVSLNNDLLSTN